MPGSSSRLMVRAWPSMMPCFASLGMGTQPSAGKNDSLVAAGDSTVRVLSTILAVTPLSGFSGVGIRCRVSTKLEALADDLGDSSGLAIAIVSEHLLVS